MGSRGSVIPILLNQNRLKKNFTITDKRMTRFNISLNEAVSFVMNCISKMKGNEIFIPKCSSYRIMDVAKAINPKVKIKFIGIRPAEKIHEELINKSEYFNSVETKNGFVIYQNITKFNKKLKEGISYNSNENKNFLSVKKIRELINKNISDFEK